MSRQQKHYMKQPILFTTPDCICVGVSIESLKNEDGTRQLAGQTLSSLWGSEFDYNTDPEILSYFKQNRPMESIYSYRFRFITPVEGCFNFSELNQIVDYFSESIWYKFILAQEQPNNRTPQINPIF